MSLRNDLDCFHETIKEPLTIRVHIGAAAEKRRQKDNTGNFNF